jgi:hypothetical protein
MPDDTKTPETPKGEFREARPNPQWPEQLRALIRFYVKAQGEKLAPCPVCGSRKPGRWTMLCPFRAYTLGAFKVVEAGTFDPLTLVCSDHPINPTEAIMDAL